VRLEVDRRGFLRAFVAANGSAMFPNVSHLSVWESSETGGNARFRPLSEVRRLAMEDALGHAFERGVLNIDNRSSSEDFGVLHREAMLAGLAAFEFTDSAGFFRGQSELREAAIGAVDSVSSVFRPTGVVGQGDMNSAYFSLVPLTRALVKLKGHVDTHWHSQAVERCERLFSAAAAHINRNYDYLNPRALEAVSALGLHRLTGKDSYLQRSAACLDELIKRQYPCGAQPYHTGEWVWGRKPAQHYQFLTANLMLYLGLELKRNDSVEYVKRIADYSCKATNRWGEAFVSTFEGLHKSRILGCAELQWVMAVALGQQRFRNMAAAAYRLWLPQALDFQTDSFDKLGHKVPKTGYLQALNEALYLGVKEIPDAGTFSPLAGLHALPDISTVFVHEGPLDLSMSLIGGYSALAEADYGNVKLFALTPELTDEPTFRNAGIDARRFAWRIPNEQLECRVQDGKSTLRGRVYTTWDLPASEQVYRAGRSLDENRAYRRLLEVSMEYSRRELLLQYHTVSNAQPANLPARLLFLLIARPFTTAPRLEVNRDFSVATPPAVSKDRYFAEAPVGRVRFSAIDNSAIEVLPEESLAERITVERPSEEWVQDSATRRVRVKEANEGSLRLAFEGYRVLDRGRYRIRFSGA
jgi:hypothetical protein